jgi:cysteine synthase A
VPDTTVYEEVVRVPNDAASDTARRMAREEGLLVGVSSGAAVCAAAQVARRADSRGSPSWSSSRRSGSAT